jgi:hypothetical protein
MNVAEALDRIRQVGLVESCGDSLKLKFPERERSALQPAIDTLRSGKAEALALLAEVNEQEATAPRTEQARAETLESIWKDRVIELWSTSSGTFFLVTNEADARRAMKCFGGRRGQIYTATEARRIIAVKDPSVVAEIHDWKQRFDGVIREFRGGDDPK